MNAKKPIVFVMGVPGHFYMTPALARIFDRPVIGLVAWARLDAQFTAERYASLSAVHSLSDFYLQALPALKKMTRAELDSLQAALEKKLGIDSSAPLSYYDRGLRWAGDFMKIRYYQVAVLQFVDQFLSEHAPAFVLDGVVTYFQNVLRLACRKKNIPYLTTGHARTIDRICLLRDNGQQIGLKEVFTALQEGRLNAISAADLREADALFDNFISRPATPSYERNNSVLGFNVKRLWKKISYVFRRENILPGEKITRTDRALNYEAYPLASLYNGLRGKCRLFTQKIYNVFEKTPSFDVPFFYLPLHHTPEVSDLYFGTAYDHHLGFVTQLARYLPSDSILYVKEHTSMLGRRPTGFYRELNRLYNVQMIAPEVSTFNLIRKSRATITVTGTAGWESFLLGRPVIALGDVFYNALPGVLHTTIGSQMPATINSYLQNFRDDPQTRRNACRAYYATTIKATQGDIGHNITLAQAEDHADAYARNLQEFLQKWGAIIEGELPQEICAAAGNIEQDTAL